MQVTPDSSLGFGRSFIRVSAGEPRFRFRSLATFGPGTRWQAAPNWRIGIEAETVIGDTQALERRLMLKRRDGGIDNVILLVADTPRNRAALASAPAAFSDLPMRTRTILAALRAGVDPAGSGIVII